MYMVLTKSARKRAESLILTLAEMENKSVTLKTVDKKGRVMLGLGFAKQIVEIDDSNPARIIITLIKTIPASEAWLY